MTAYTSRHLQLRIKSLNRLKTITVKNTQTSGKSFFAKNEERMEYSVLRSHFLSELVADVNKAIEKKWKPLGGVAYMTTEGYFLQAMTRDLSK